MVFQVMAMLILLAFYGCYVGKMIAQKRQGIVTNQVGKGKKGMVWAIEVIMSSVSSLTLLVEVISILLGWTALPTPFRWLGALLGAAGAAFFAVSVATMRDSWRAGVPEADKTTLVTSGVYEISRNPAFLGFDLIYAGILLMFFNGWLLAISALAMLMLHLQIVNVEEPFLQQTFGEAYLAYQRRVRRYLGRKRSA